MIATIVFSMAISVILVPQALAGQSLDPRLASLEPLLSRNWTGMLKAPDGSNEWEQVCRYEPAWGGKVIRFTRSVPARKSYEEGFIYWDDISKRTAFFAVQSSAVFAAGFVSAERNVITFEGKMTWPSPPPNPEVKQSYDFRNTFEFTSESEMVDRWYQNAFGPWRPGHVITFTAKTGKGAAAEPNCSFIRARAVLKGTKRD